MSELEVRRFKSQTGRIVEAVVVKDAESVAALRAAEGWHEGAVRVLTYVTADAVGFVSVDNPKSFFGQLLSHGNVVVKGEAGDFRVWDASEFAAEFEEVAA